LPLFTRAMFEPNATALLGRLLREGDCLLDVGANEGAYSLAAGAVVGPTGLVVAVEPSRREIERLRHNIAANDMADRCGVIEAALDAVPGSVEFAIAEAAHAGQNAFAGLLSPKVAEVRRSFVPALTLDMVLTRSAPRRPTLVKIDVEGAEGAVLSGAARTIAEARPAILVEAARSEGSADNRVAMRLAEAGYRLFAIDDELGSAWEIDFTRGEPQRRIETLLAISEEMLAQRWPSAPRI
jgi:FkbM family methyltransferase